MTRIAKIELLGLVYLEAQSDALERLDDIEIITPHLDDQIHAIDNRRAYYNPVRYLQNVWERATFGRKLKGINDDLKQEGEGLKVEVSTKVSDLADQLVAEVAKSDPNVAARLSSYHNNSRQLKQGIDAVGEIDKATNRVLSIVHRARKEVSEAKDMEVVDMIGSNAFTTLLSHSETSEAKSHLGRVSKALETYKTYMQGKGEELSGLQLSTVRADEIGQVAEWDFWMGIADLDVFSFFTSYRNHGQLSNAGDKLDQLSSKLSGFKEKCRQQMNTLAQEMVKESEAYCDLRHDVVKGHDLPETFREFLPQDAESFLQVRTHKLSL